MRSFPERFVATVTKSKRHGKIFVDYLRNQDGATAIAPYSTRAREGAPVAAPIAWEELEVYGGGNHFTIRDADQLLERASSKMLAGWGQATDALKKEGRDVLRPEIGYDIHVVGRPRLTEERAGDRPGDEIRHAERLEREVSLGDRLDGPPDRREHPLGLVLEDGEEDLLDAREVRVEGAAGEAGRADELVDGDPADGFLGEDLARRPEQPGAERPRHLRAPLPRIY